MREILSHWVRAPRGWEYESTLLERARRLGHEAGWTQNHKMEREFEEVLASEIAVAEQWANGPVGETPAQIQERLALQSSRWSDLKATRPESSGWRVDGVALAGQMLLVLIAGLTGVALGLRFGLAGWGALMLLPGMILLRPWTKLMMLKLELEMHSAASAHRWAMERAGCAERWVEVRQRRILGEFRLAFERGTKALELTQSRERAALREGRKEQSK